MTEKTSLQLGRTPEEDERLKQRFKMAAETLQKGDIGRIEALTPELVGQKAICIGGEFSNDLILEIMELRADDRTVLVDAGPGRPKVWLPVDDLRLFSALQRIVNAPLESDEKAN